MVDKIKTRAEAVLRAEGIHRRTTALFEKAEKRVEKLGLPKIRPLSLTQALDSYHTRWLIVREAVRHG